MEESAHKAGSDRLAVADQELLHGRWSAAKGTFESILADSPDHPRALDGLGLALFWLGDSRRAREARESAYVAHRRRGDARGAAAAALFVAVDYRLSEGNTAAWGGWLARAERCLEGSGPCAEGGETLVERAKTTGDPLRAERLAREALDLARELDEPNLETSALSQVGMALVRRGRWEEGMGLLDEAMAIATGGEATDARAIGDTCCQTLAACDQLADLERASQWCRVVIDFAERRNYTPIYAWCRAIYAGVLTLGGDWDRADRELAQALRIYEQFGGIGSRMLALARLADLRYREGRVEEAERLLAGCEDHPLAVPVVARLRLLRRELGAASEMLERALAALPDETAACAPLLPVLVDV
jgi:tetratricopeptide (TPR) repeat protein